MNNLNLAIKDLDNGKSRDLLGHENKLLKCSGSDLKLPESLQVCNITSLYKHKGSHIYFINYSRVVFRVTVFISILDGLIYNDCYTTIDDNLTDGNVGACKNRNRDNLFVM